MTTPLEEQLQAENAKLWQKITSLSSTLGYAEGCLEEIQWWNAPPELHKKIQEALAKLKKDK